MQGPLPLVGLLLRTWEATAPQQAPGNKTVMGAFVEPQISALCYFGEVTQLGRPMWQDDVSTLLLLRKIRCHPRGPQESEWLEPGGQLMNPGCRILSESVARGFMHVIGQKEAENGLRHLFSSTQVSMGKCRAHSSSPHFP